jgi:D-3-phosphoglycerate dehydrogenase
VKKSLKRGINIDCIRVSKSFSDSSLKELNRNSNFPIKVGFENDKDCKAIIVRSRDFVNEQLLNLFPNLKSVVSATSGFDHFDLKFVKSKTDIFFGYSPEANVISCAELTLMHALNLLKNQHTHLEPLRSEMHLAQELNGMTALIVGFGRIGKRVSALLQAFGVKVLAYDPYVFKKDFAILNVTPVSLKDGLKDSDLVTLHCPATQKTKEMVNREFLKSMKNESFLINCARGSLVNEEELIKALKSRTIQGAALDVFQMEPLPQDSPFWSLSNAYLSPHLGGFTHKAQIRSALEALKQIEDHFRGEKSGLKPLPLDALWFKDLGPDAY